RPSTRFTKPPWLPVDATTARPAFARTITRTTTERLCSIPMGTTLKPSVTRHSDAMKHPIINVDQIELPARPAQYAAPGDAAQRFDARMGEVAPRIGARKLGYNVTAVPP